MTGFPPRPQLRSTLLLWLTLPLLVLVALAGVFGIYTTRLLTDRVYDRWLLDAAQSLAGQVRFDGTRAQIDLPAAARAMLAYDEIDLVHYSVSQAGSLIAGDAGIPTSGRRLASYDTGAAYDARYAGVAVRVGVSRVSAPATGAGVLVLVAETTRKRQQTAAQIELMLVPVGLLLIVAALAAAYAVRRTLRPLQAIAGRWNAQSHVSLQPVDVINVPGELLPFAQALNDLLQRIRSMILRERQFAATVAHQLRTPLTGLQLGLARAAEAPDLASARRVIAEIAPTTQRAARLVQQLLALGRADPESGASLERSAVDLAALTRDVGASFLDLAASRAISLEFETSAAPIIVDINAELMAEALGNIVDNALRYTPVGGSVLLRVHAAPASVSVDDSGPGIPPGERALVLERFVRGTSAAGEGSGLGLAIVRDIVAAHGGSIAIGASPLGGSRVTIVLGATG